MERRQLPNAQPPAPSFEVAPREVVAVEHPAIIKNLDNAVKTFGRNQPFERILNSNDPEECVPLYLRFNDPTSVPILSHNSPTSNVLLKITVPRRTGRKRKRGSQDPYTDDNLPVLSPGGGGVTAENNVCSQSRIDRPTSILRKLEDNVGRYAVEAVAEIRQTHRFRGLADFHQSTTHSEFFSKFRDTALTGNIEKMRQFKFDPSRGYKLNEEILPPPSMTYHTLPFNWGWHQNPNIVEELDPATGKPILTNNSRLVKHKSKYLDPCVEFVPQRPSQKVPDDPLLQELIKEVKIAFDERPIWTKRAVMKRVCDSPGLYLIREALAYVGYRFKRGPFRDAIVKYGVDPRKDAKFRVYQTLYFLFHDEDEKIAGTPWHDPRTSVTLSRKTQKEIASTTYHFDGKSFAEYGRIFQMCDVTDPLLARLIRDAPLRQEFEPESDGWFYNGTCAKIKSIMRAKLLALRDGKQLIDEDFKAALEFPDNVPNRLTKHLSIPVPNMKLTAAALKRLRESGGDITAGSRERKRTYLGPLRLRQHRSNTNTMNEESLEVRRRSTGTVESPKSKTPERRVETGREQSLNDSLDPRLLADREDNDPEFGIGDDGAIDNQAREFRYDGDGDVDDEVESERDEDDSDRSEESEDEDSEMEGFERYENDNEDDEDRERDDSDSANSIDFVRHFDPQLAQDEGLRIR